jgi:chaperonin cofactor prefoldin
MATTKEDIELRIKVLYNKQDTIESKTKKLQEQMKKLQEQYDAIDTQIYHLECNLAAIL